MPSTRVSTHWNEVNGSMLSPSLGKAQSNLIAFLIAIVVIILFVFGIFFAISDVSSPQEKLDYHTVIQQQLDGGAVLIYFNSTSSPRLEVVNITAGTSYQILQIYTNQKGAWLPVNPTKVCLDVNGKDEPYSLSNPLEPGEVVYLPSSSGDQEVSLLLSAYGVTQFAFAVPNSTVIA